MTDLEMDAEIEVSDEELEQAGNSEPTLWPTQPGYSTCSEGWTC